jgi:hypothetical protein
MRQQISDKPLQPQVLTMSLFVVSHGHTLRVTIRRRRAAKTGRMTTVLFHADCFQLWSQADA